MIRVEGDRAPCRRSARPGLSPRCQRRRAIWDLASRSRRDARLLAAGTAGRIFPDECVASGYSVAVQRTEDIAGSAWALRTAHRSPAPISSASRSGLRDHVDRCRRRLVRDPGADRDLAHRVLSEPRLEDAAEARLVHFLGGDLDLFGCGADGVRAKFCGREILELPAGLCRPASSRRHVRDARREADDPCIVTGGLVDGTGGVGEPRRWAGARSGLHRSALHVVGACTISRRTACRRERGGLKV